MWAGRGLVAVFATASTFSFPGDVPVTMDSYKGDSRSPKLKAESRVKIYFTTG